MPKEIHALQVCRNAPQVWRNVFLTILSSSLLAESFQGSLSPPLNLRRSIRSWCLRADTATSCFYFFVFLPYIASWHGHIGRHGTSSSSSSLPPPSRLAIELLPQSSWQPVQTGLWFSNPAPLCLANCCCKGVACYQSLNVQNLASEFFMETTSHMVLHILVVKGSPSWHHVSLCFFLLHAFFKHLEILFFNIFCIWPKLYFCRFCRKLTIAIGSTWCRLFLLYHSQAYMWASEAWKHNDASLSSIINCTLQTQRVLYTLMISLKLVSESKVLTVICKLHPSVFDGFVVLLLLSSSWLVSCSLDQSW